MAVRQLNTSRNSAVRAEAYERDLEFEKEIDNKRSNSVKNGSAKKSTSAGSKSTSNNNLTKKGSQTLKNGVSKKSGASKSSSSRKGKSKTSNNRGKSKKKNDRGSFFNPGENEIFFAEVTLIASLVIGVLIFISYIGVGPDFINSFSFGLFGTMAYLFPFILFAATVFFLHNRGKMTAYRKFASGLGLFITICALCQAVNGPVDNMYFKEFLSNSIEGRCGGGIIGALLYKPLYSILGSIGTVVVIIALFLVFFMLFTGKAIILFMEKRSTQAVKQKNEEFKRRREQIRIEKEEEKELKRREEEYYRNRRPAQMVNFDKNGTAELYSIDIPDELLNIKKKKTSYIDELKERGRNRSKANNTVNEMADMDIQINNVKNRDLEKNEFTTERENETYYIKPGEPQTAAKYKEPKIYSGIDMEEIIDGTNSLSDFNEEAKIYSETEDLTKDIKEAVRINTENSNNRINDINENAVNGIDSNNIESSIIEENNDTESCIIEESDIIKESNTNCSNTNINENNSFKREGAAAKEHNKEEQKLSDISERIAERAGAAQDLGVMKGTDGEPDIVINTITNKEEVYVFPPIELLSEARNTNKRVSQDELHETALKLQNTLNSFGVRANVTNASCGPAVTRYELTPEMGVKVSKITGLADDIKLNLAAQDIRIEAPIPGKAAVGIEVPNKEISTVYFRELIESSEYEKSISKLSFAVGKDIGGQTVVADIAKTPHLLIAGATGSGKSVCINTLIMSILYKAEPSEVKLIMIDPKVVELSVYNGIPHLLIPVVTEPKKASAALNWAVAEMDERYNKFSELGVRDLKGYNEKVKSMPKEEDMLYETMPQIVIIVDELADLMMVASNEVETAICRLAQKARAAGMHLIIATQRPSVNVITGVIKANIPSRIAFSVSSQIDSRTILDGSGAESLLGKGDMLLLLAGMSKPKRVQGAFVSDNEVINVVEFLKENNKSTGYNDAVNSHIANAALSADEGTKGTKKSSDKDDYFVEAGHFIIEKQKASIGALQRTYSIGFNRAARIMDQLFEAGVVGAEEGTKPRKILMTMEEFTQYINENNL